MGRRAPNEALPGEANLPIFLRRGLPLVCVGAIAAIHEQRPLPARILGCRPVAITFRVSTSGSGLFAPNT